MRRFRLTLTEDEVFQASMALHFAILYWQRQPPDPTGINERIAGKNIALVDKLAKLQRRHKKARSK